MKKTTFLTLTCLFFAFGNFAYTQNWKPVLTDKTQYFIGPDSAGVDSIIWGFKTYFVGVYGADSSFTFNRIWRNAYPGMTPVLAVCPPDTTLIQYYNYLYFIYDRENVGGDGMIRKPGGEFWFHGPQSDTIKFKTQLPVGTRWEFRSGTLDSAAIVSRTTAMIYGVMDSILEISTDQGARYVLSKDHGLLDWPYFYPLMKRSGFVLQAGGSLFGIEEDGFGRHIPRYADFYDFNPGDRFRRYTFAGYTYPGGNDIHVDFYTIGTPISTTVPYTFNAVRESYNYSTGLSVYESEPFETVHCPYNPAFDALPGELPAGSVNATNGLFLSYLKTNSAMNGRITAHYLNPQLMDTCWKIGFFDDMWGWDGMHIMGEGIGTVESSYNYWMQNSGEWDHQRLICYAKKGYWNGFCDQLVHYVGVDPESAFSSFDIYPQPAQNSVILDFGDETLRNGQIMLFSTNGQLLRTIEHPSESTFSIDISDLPDGMYLLQLRTSDGNTQMKKLMVLR